ncbi:cytochrome-c peroxidase [Cupriavidus pauculus]|uniref:Cytochrome-c peroxidase n=1 Tax=Cupriavidus pauculus TaxID=82633 RepID=A0A2N5CD26_9BURK|nr:cytochrome c peroxidase [Cupriavidus pauculus]PLQ00085.1 cytochrome-c peroxidase [Cupriavidus pauculus]
MRVFPFAARCSAALLAVALAACQPATDTGKPARAAASGNQATAQSGAVQPVPTKVAAVAAAPASSLSAAAQVGAKLFFDPSLSGSGKMSCATCHDPGHAYAPANDLSVQLGGPDGRQPGTRAVPTLMYKEYTNAYSDTFENPDMISPPGPGGGLTWDGRANTIAEQAAIPLLAPNEMAAAGKSAVVDAVRNGAHADAFRQAYGPNVFDDADKAFALVGAALQAFQVEDRSFHPYSSKFDRYRTNKVGGALNDAEIRGLRVFMDPTKGNCMACHLLGGGNDGSQDMTSDYSFAAIGVPRNRDIPANADPKYFDLGLCGPLRTDHRPGKDKGAAATCGMFKTPVLRNAATRHAFMHNGVFRSLEEVVRFYNTRDTAPEKWYPRDARGKVAKFNDLPAKYRANLDEQMPLDQRRAGSPPPMTDQEMQDLIAFLNTLTDGYVAPATAAGDAHGHTVANAYADPETHKSAETH